MDSDFLKEYDAREIEAFKEGFSIDKRVGKLKSPISYVIPGSLDLIWSQIAFSGTVIFPLHPYSENILGKKGPNSKEEISDLIQFVKETKKIQFVLTDFPTKYESLEYLEPILEEFLPPGYMRPGEDKKYCKLESICNAEVRHLIKFSPEWKLSMVTPKGRALMTSHIRSYTVLRHLGFNDIADTFIDHFLTDPDFSEDYITNAYNLLCHPIIDPLKANPSFSSYTIDNAKSLGLNAHFSTKRSAFPEVGSYLMKKCTHYPESLNACKMLIDRYEENDLYSTFSALNDGVVDRNDTCINQKKNDLQMILDNLWNDSTIRQNATGYYYGINIACGMIGYCLLGTPGFLGTLGLSAVDSTNSMYLDQFSELISKKVASPYIATIYDFKKKYSL